MQPDQRIVTRIPLTELWDAGGVLPLERGRAVGRDHVADLLRTGPVRFVLANCGSPLNWVPLDDCYRFWKREVKLHLVEPAAAEVGFRLEDWPGGYCYQGTEWTGGSQEAVVLLETYH
jgi:hypothetical protein